MDRVRAIARRLQPHAESIGIGIVAISIAWTFAWVAMQHTRQFSLPLDDAYIYLTYAKQMGRGQPFTYYPGGGYSAGATSPLWPMVLAPFWTLGARGHHLVWVSFGLCTALYTATCVGCQLLVRRLFGRVAGVYAGALTLGIAPFAFCALSGMEVALAAALLIATIALILRAPADGKPRRLLIACLAATSLARPEAMLIVLAIVVVAAVQRVRRRDVRAALWWLSPLIAPALWLATNRVFAGHWFPNTGVAKSHFYLPGFDWSYWWDAVTDQGDKLVHRLFWGDDGIAPLVWPRVVLLFWLLGAVRVMLWAAREKRWLAGALIVGSPIALCLAVLASSGAWAFHNYRYIAAAFPLIAIGAACGLAPPVLADDVAWRRPVRGVAMGLGGLLLVGFLDASRAHVSADITLYAQSASDLDHQVVTVGRYIHDKLPDARIMLHDAGALAYYSDVPVYDMLGLVTNHQAAVASNGPGARFEFLESLPPEERPTHFAYYPVWMGQGEFFGEQILRTPVGPKFGGRRLIGDYDMQLIAATWDHAGTAERPLATTPGWHVVDRVDIADVASEADHGWRGELGRRAFDDPTAKWSFVHRQTAPALIVDGGRTIREGRERMTVTVDRQKPVRLVLRTGGERSYGWHDPIRTTVALRVLSDDGTELGGATIEPPKGPIVEIAFDLRATEPELTFRTEADGPYRAMHWFVLQPD